MAANFLGCDRDQELLLPPSLREWLPDNHFAWFVLDCVAGFDLSAFYADYRADGHGRAAHDPSMMVALLLYSYARGTRSSRAIERGCIEDVACRVIAANRVPDHCTISRFRQRHQAALAGLFGDVLALCAQAGLIGLDVVAVDGTKVHANASHHANRDYEQLAREVLEHAAETDRLEDEQFGDRRGDELPPELATGEGRRAWLLDAKRRLEAQRVAEARPVPGPRPARARAAKRRLEEDLAAEIDGNQRYEAYRAGGVMRDGRRFGRRPDPYTPPAIPAGKVNLTDPDSRNLKTTSGYMQAYNAQAVVTAGQIVLAAEISTDSLDTANLQPMIQTACRELHRAGIDGQPGLVLADAGYWRNDAIEALINQGIQTLIAPDADRRKAPRPGRRGGLYDFTRRILQTDRGKQLYLRRQGMIEPVFGQIKHNRGARTFHHRGRAAVRTEWRMLTATHNLLKLHQHHLAATGPPAAATSPTRPTPDPNPPATPRAPRRPGINNVDLSATASARSASRRTVLQLRVALLR